MNAPPFPANPTFGQFFGNWVWSGSRWVCTNTNGIRIVTQVFRASGPYTPSPGLVSCVVETIGGGGSGGAVLSTPSATAILSGGGGGSGGYSRVALASGLVLGGVNVIIGAGGDAQTTQPGGVTSFGAFCVSNGGNPGLDNAASSQYFGGSGSGAAPGVGDVAYAGAPGHCGVAVIYPTFLDTNAQGGMGGWVFGGNVVVDTGPAAYNEGAPCWPNTGAGGVGGCANQIAPPIGIVYGGAGGSGICIVTEYCWADAIDDGCGCGPTGQARVAYAGSPQGYGFDND